MPRARRGPVARDPPCARESVRQRQLVALGAQFVVIGGHCDRRRVIPAADLDDGHPVGGCRPDAPVDDHHPVPGGPVITLVRQPFHPLPGRLGIRSRYRGDTDQIGRVQRRDLAHQRAHHRPGSRAFADDGHRRGRAQRQDDGHPTDDRSATHQPAGRPGGDRVGGVVGAHCRRHHGGRRRLLAQTDTHRAELRDVLRCAPTSVGHQPVSTVSRGQGGSSAAPRVVHRRPCRAHRRACRGIAGTRHAGR